MADAGAPPELRPGPARGIEEAFARAAERMRGLPVCNPALRVEVVGLRAWDGDWLGAVVSPWTVSLFLVPAGGGRFRRLATGERQRWTFPLGDFEFLGADDAALGPYQTCSLLSPPWGLASHDEACAAAVAALDALLSPPRGAAAPGAEAGAGSPAVGEPGARALSRRAFLLGARRVAP